MEEEGEEEGEDDEEEDEDEELPPSHPDAPSLLMSETKMTDHEARGLSL